MEKKQELFSPKETVEMTGIETETLRKYVEYFNIQTEWTKPNNKGHRRYTRQNVKELIDIRDKVHNQNWSWKQVNRWRSGDEDFFVEKEEKSRLEKKLDLTLEQLETQQNQLKTQENFNKVLVEKLDQILQENVDLKNRLETKQTERDKLLLETIEQKMTEQKEKKKSFFSKIFKA